MVKLGNDCLEQLISSLWMYWYKGELPRLRQYTGSSLTGHVAFQLLVNLKVNCGDVGVLTVLYELTKILQDNEDEHLEFKAARNTYSFDKLARYSAALANEGGGKFILGVTDTRPRQVVGTKAFANLEKTKNDLLTKLQFRVEAQAVQHPDGRVIIFNVPARPVGRALSVDGVYYMRSGESLTPMTPEMLKRIFDEAVTDFSATLSPATMDDLSSEAIQILRALWHRKSGNEALLTLSDEQLLSDAELIVDSGVTYAALILLSTRAALGRFLADAEVIYEYRSNEADIRYAQRVEHREGFLLFRDALWNTINLRNDVQHIQDGLFLRDLPTFNEKVVREAILNAICHRDYQQAGSVFVRQFPRKLELVSPGGFPSGITSSNILKQQRPRNRRVAETLARCGLVERSGQGMDTMFRESIREGKAKPDFTHTDEHFVFLTLYGEIQDPRFVQFLEKVGQETLKSFTVDDFILLDTIYKSHAIPEDLKARLPRLIDQGIIEQVGKGRNVKYLLSKQFYSFLGERGGYTRRRGLDRATNKTLLMEHLKGNRREGAQLRELMQVLPGQSKGQVQWLMRELKKEGRAKVKGKGPAARWYVNSE